MKKFAIVLFVFFIVFITSIGYGLSRWSPHKIRTSFPKDWRLVSVVMESIEGRSDVYPTCTYNMFFQDKDGRVIIVEAKKSAGWIINENNSYITEKDITP